MRQKQRGSVFGAWHGVRQFQINFDFKSRYPLPPTERPGHQDDFTFSFVKQRAFGHFKQRGPEIYYQAVARPRGVLSAFQIIRRFGKFVPSAQLSNLSRFNSAVKRPLSHIYILYRHHMFQ